MAQTGVLVFARGEQLDSPVFRLEVQGARFPRPESFAKLVLKTRTFPVKLYDGGDGTRQEHI